MVTQFITPPAIILKTQYYSKIVTPSSLTRKIKHPSHSVPSKHKDDFESSVVPQQSIKKRQRVPRNKNSEDLPEYVTDFLYDSAKPKWIPIPKVSPRPVSAVPNKQRQCSKTPNKQVIGSCTRKKKFKQGEQLKRAYRLYKPYVLRISPRSKLTLFSRHDLKQTKKSPQRKTHLRHRGLSQVEKADSFHIFTEKSAIEGGMKRLAVSFGEKLWKLSQITTTFLSSLV